jgi:WD40 repeat protein
LSWGPAQSVVRILGPKSATAGTGTAGTAFFLTDGEGALLASCAHVIRDNSHAGPGQFVRISVERQDPESSAINGRAYVEPKYWREPEAEDIAVLRLDGAMPARSAALPLVPLLDDSRVHRSWGFPVAKAVEGLAATVSGLAPAMDAGRPALQGRSEEVSFGFSGAPVWDDESDAAIGMVMSIVGAEADAGGRQKTTFFIRPTEEIWRVCPEARGLPDNPYRGLAVFEDEDASLYNGRSRAIETLIARLSEADFVAVVGPSGSGKSSLVRAGLTKGLDATPVFGLAGKLRLSFRPGMTPALDLVMAAAEHASPGVLEGRLGLSGGELHPGEHVQEVLGPRIRALDPGVLAGAVRGALAAGAILIVDQFERLFTDCPDEGARWHFADTLLAIASEEIKVLLTLRADFYGRVLEILELGEAVDRAQVTVLPMTHDELLDAVLKPARTHRRVFEPGLAEQLVDDVEGSAGSLPLLQLALTELWARDASAGILRKSTYDALGTYTTAGEALRIRGVIAAIAEELWQRLNEDQRVAGSRLLLSLVAPASVGAGAGGTARASRRIWWAELDDEMRCVADDLVDARLLTTASDPTTGKPTVEVAHEALIWAWPRLARLAEKHADFVRWYDADLAPFFRRWQEGGSSSDQFLRGDALKTAEEWLRTAPELLAAPATDFIERSISEREKEEERRRREAERERERQRALRLSESLRLASEARAATAAEPQTALLVAWEALLRDHNELSEAVFREALERLPSPVRVLRSCDSPRVTLGFLSDGTIYASAPELGTIELWDVSGASIGGFQVEGGGTTIVAALRHDAHLLAYRSGVLRLHDRAGALLDSCEVPNAPLAESRIDWWGLSVADNDACLLHVDKQTWLARAADGEISTVEALKFVADSPKGPRWDETLHSPMSNLLTATLDRRGQTILTEGDDGIRVWNTDGSLRFALDDTRNPASALMLDNGTVVAGSMDGAGAVWDKTGTPRGTFREAGGRDLFICAVDPSGRYVATTVNQSGVTDIRDSTGEVIATLGGHEGHIWAIAFSADCDLAATGGDDGAIRVWDWRKQEERHRLAGRGATVKQLAFHPEDSATLISTDSDGSVRLWQLAAAVIPRYVGHRGHLHAFETTPVGVISSGEDNTSRIWSSTGRSATMEGRLLTWTRTTASGTALAVTAARGPVVRLWELGPSDPVQLCEVSTRERWPNASEINDAAISSDGRFLALVAQAWAVLLETSDGGGTYDVIGPDGPDVEESHRAITGFGFRPDGSRLVIASSNGTVWLWNTDGRAAGSFVAARSSPDRIFDLGIDPLGELIATGVRWEAGLWDWDGHRVGKLNTLGYKVRRVAFSPDGGLIVTVADNANVPGSEYVVELWRRSGERIGLLDVRGGLGRRPVFDHEGRYFCMPSRGGVAVLNRDGRRLTTLVGAPRTYATAFVMEPNAELVVAAFSDGLGRLWSPKSGRHRATMRIGDAEGLTFSPDGGELLVATPSGAIDRHALDVKDLFPLAAERVEGTLSQEELERFGIDTPLLRLDAMRPVMPERVAS